MEPYRIDRLHNNHNELAAFVGLNDINKEGVFVWSNGGDSRYTGPWGSANPDDTMGNQDCVRLTLWNEQVVLDDSFCEDALPFICGFCVNGMKPSDNCYPDVSDHGIAMTVIAKYMHTNMTTRTLCMCDICCLYVSD